jgi:hypothetical protein
MAKTKLYQSGETIRTVHVKALCDFECITHCCRKGMIYEIQSDHAQILLDDGKVEVVSEQAAIAQATKAEKRG